MIHDCWVHARPSDLPNVPTASGTSRLCESRSFGTSHIPWNQILARSCTKRYRPAPLKPHSYKYHGGRGGLVQLSVDRSLRRHTLNFRADVLRILCASSTLGACPDPGGASPRWIFSRFSAANPFESADSQAQPCNTIRMNTYINAALKTLWNEHLQKNRGELRVFYGLRRFRAVDRQLSRG